MDSNDEVVIDTELDTETTENIEDTETEEEVDVEALKKENATLKAQKDHWKKKASEPKVEVEVKNQGSLSVKDSMYLASLSAKGEIHEDDVEEMLDFAQLKKISVKEAHAFYRPILKERQEERATALATQSRGGSRGTSKDTPEAILARASKGQLSEDSTEIEKLAAARMAAKLKK